MLQIRCSKCKTLLAKEDMRDGRIEIKCPRCNTYNTVERIIVDNRNKGAYNDYK